VAQRIRALESEMGFSLIMRSGRTVSTTESGAATVGRVREKLVLLKPSSLKGNDVNAILAIIRSFVMTRARGVGCWSTIIFPRSASARGAVRA
jgi:hypothetical protein